MTKIEYIDFIRNSLSMVDKTAKFHRAQVEAAINLAVNSAFYDLYAKGDKHVKKSMERYSTLTVISPGLSTSLPNRYRASLSVDVVDLPRVSGGVLEIIRKSDPNTSILSTTFVPVSTMAGEQFYGSEASLPSNVIGFSYSGSREIEFWGMSSFIFVVSHYARIIKQFKSHSNTDNVVLPYGKEEQIIEMVRQYLGAIPPKDLVNNNTERNG